MTMFDLLNAYNKGLDIVFPLWIKGPDVLFMSTFVGVALQ